VTTEGEEKELQKLINQQINEKIYDKSFIIVLERLQHQALAAVKRSEPCVDDQHQDGIKLGELYMIQKVIRAFKSYG